MTKKIKKVLLNLCISIFIACTVLFLVSCAYSGDKYTGLTGVKGQEEVLERVTLDNFALDISYSEKENSSIFVFKASVSDEDLSKLPNNAKFGTIIIPKSLNGGKLTVSTENAVITYANEYQTVDGGAIYSATLSAEKANEDFSILTADFNKTEFMVRSFVTYAYADTEDVIYTDTIVKTPQQMANYCLSNKAVAQYTEQQIINLKNIAEEVDKIGYFDTEYGATQLTSEIAKISYESGVKNGSEKGSTEIEWESAPAANAPTITLTDTILKNISDYTILYFKIYNPNDFIIVFKFGTKFGATELKEKSWTLVSARVEDLFEEENFSDLNVLSATDITGIRMSFNLPAGSTETLVGAKVYLSAMTAIKNVDGKIGYFDTEFGLTQLTTTSHPHSLSYSTDVKYGDEAGSLKVTINRYNQSGVIVGQGLFAKFNDNLFEKDISVYDYIEFYVYSPNKSIQFTFYQGVGRKDIAKGDWRCIQINTSNLADAKNLKDSIYDITGLGFCFTDGNGLDKLEVGDVIYISAVYGKN